MRELGNILDNELVIGCSFCIKKRGTAYVLKLLKNYVKNETNYINEFDKQRLKFKKAKNK